MADIIYLKDIFPNKFKKTVKKTTTRVMSTRRALKSSLMDQPKSKQQRPNNNLKSEN